VASSTHAEQGYATAAFGAIALALAVVATALLAFSNNQLRIARVALRHAERDALLDGALVLAADAVMRESQTARLSWGLDVDGLPVTLLAEPEGFKVSAARPEALGKEAIEALAGPAPLRAAAASEDLSAARQALAARSDSAAWRACAQSFLSPVSDAEKASLAPPTIPAGGEINWRVGEVWRIAAFAKGRSADAIVRFTGDPERPMAVLDLQRGAAEAPDATYCHRLVAAGSEN
jgi:hypothetical protein